MSLSRREFIAAAGALTAATGMTFEDAMAQTKFRLRQRPPVVVGSQRVMVSTDLSQVGAYRFPLGAGGLSNGQLMGGGLAVRTVSGATRIFTLSDYVAGQWDAYTLIEFERPAAAPTSTASSAPYLTYVRNWGNVAGGAADPPTILLTGGATASLRGSMLWDDQYNGIWCTYGDGYVPVTNHPTLFFVQLNDSTHATTTYGPWRIRASGPRFVGGQLFWIPTAYQSGMAGANIGVTGVSFSGASGCPQGPDMHVWVKFNPLTTPANIIANNNTAVVVEDIMHYDTTNTRIRTTTRYRSCQWGATGNYDCRSGITISTPNNLWGGGDFAASLDSCTGLAFIDKADFRGIMHIGQLINTPSGYTAPGDPDGYVHFWYARYDHASFSGSTAAGYIDKACCHLQPDPWWGTTGPGAHARNATGWIHEPNRLAEVHAGTKTNHEWESAVSTDEFNLSDRVAQFTRNPPTSVSDTNAPRDGFVGPLAHDDTNRLLYGFVSAETSSGGAVPYVQVMSY